MPGACGAGAPAGTGVCEMPAASPSPLVEANATPKHPAAPGCDGTPIGPAPVLGGWMGRGAGGAGKATPMQPSLGGSAGIPGSGDGALDAGSPAVGSGAVAAARSPPAEAGPLAGSADSPPVKVIATHVPGSGGKLPPTSMGSGGRGAPGGADAGAGTPAAAGVPGAGRLPGAGGVPGAGALT